MRRSFHTYPPKWELHEADDFTANFTELINENSVIQRSLVHRGRIERGGNAVLTGGSAGLSLAPTQL
jgi:hypothetical protein